MRSESASLYLAAGILSVLVLFGCASDESKSTDVLGTVSGHSVLLQENTQGPDAPCIGVQVQAPGGTTVTVACPTSPAEEQQYAATVEVGPELFVVGFGLDDGETVLNDRFIDVFISDEVEGRRFFAAQVQPGEAVEAVTISDGVETRELQTA